MGIHARTVADIRTLFDPCSPHQSTALTARVRLNWVTVHDRVVTRDPRVVLYGPLAGTINRIESRGGEDRG